MPALPGWLLLRRARQAAQGVYNHEVLVARVDDVQPLVPRGQVLHEQGRHQLPPGEILDPGIGGDRAVQELPGWTRLRCRVTLIARHGSLPGWNLRERGRGHVLAMLVWVLHRDSGKREVPAVPERVHVQLTRVTPDAVRAWKDHL